MANGNNGNGGYTQKEMLNLILDGQDKINERIDEFNEWDVFITCPQKKTKYPKRTIKIGEFIIPTSTRQLINESEDKIKFANGKVSGRGIEKVGLSWDVVNEAIADWIKNMWDKISKGQVNC